ncbi:hypothetical protein ACFVS5_29235 [Streptomyces albidoflavus]|uniref:hypothetical protein n=1 Tax=Streptomyces TaxID=1883 RepID=UPI00055C8034|nr:MULTISPECIES: hypothetical protein [Streptomyces]MYX85417.1 hypothetical protein [Streptomyces sp. SID4915]AMM10561.1 Lipoprotein [Streptomyces albidoflavus]KUL68220.1 hypothetical protein ADL32_00210 [Streptomyces albidoflavus]MBK3388647.1 hypothetical protein [Streptomyces sp. DEF1AK]MCO6696532.1 hypothetical protein [Streptomyces sp. Vc17.3-30]
MPHPIRAAAAAAASTLLAATAALAAPGAASAAEDDLSRLSAEEIAERARTELRGAASLRVTLDQDQFDGGTGALEDPATADLAMDERGRCAGNVTLTRGRGSVELVKRGDEVWVKPDRDFWEAQLPGGQGTAAADTLHGRYVHGSTRDGVLAAVTEACDLDSLKEDLTGEATPDKGTRMTKGAATTAVFTPVIPLLRQEDGERVTLYVATEGPPRLVQATRTSDVKEDTVTVTGYGATVRAEPPAEEDTVDLSTLRDRLGPL